MQWRAAGFSKLVLGRDLGRRLRRESETKVSQSCVWHFAKRQKGALCCDPPDPLPPRGGVGPTSRDWPLRRRSRLFLNIACEVSLIDSEGSKFCGFGVKEWELEMDFHDHDGVKLHCATCRCQ